MKFRVIFLLMAACTFFTSYAAEKDKYLNIVYIGNSITYGAGVEDRLHNAPPVKASMFLRQKPDIKSVQFSNQGVSGATTVDFLPSTNTLFPKVTAAADQFATEDWAMLLFSVMLGTNDSAIKGPNGSPVSPSQYKENMKTILDAFLEKYPGCKIVVHRPIWYSPNTHNGALYLKEGLKRLKKYYPHYRILLKLGIPIIIGQLGVIILGFATAVFSLSDDHLKICRCDPDHVAIFHRTGALRSKALLINIRPVRTVQIRDSIPAAASADLAVNPADHPAECQRGINCGRILSDYKFILCHLDLCPHGSVHRHQVQRPGACVLRRLRLFPRTDRLPSHHTPEILQGESPV